MSNKITEMPLRDSGDNRPLPIIVALKWKFPLATHEIDGAVWYSVHDWIKGLTGESDARQAWSRLKKQLSLSTRQLPYTNDYGSTYQMDFATDEGLYKIAAYMRATKERVALGKIKDYLAKAGVFTDEVRRSRTASGKRLKRYERDGKSASWTDRRLQGIVKRRDLTDALKIAVLNVDDSVYRDSTETLYRYLWERTTAELKRDLGLKRESRELRDHMGEFALMYTAIAERVCAERLSGKTEVPIIEAMELVRTVAKLIHGQARELSEFLGVDLVTEKPLLPSRSEW